MRAIRGKLKELKAASCNDMLTTPKNCDQELLRVTVDGEHFSEYFLANIQDHAIADYPRGVIG